MSAVAFSRAEENGRLSCPCGCGDFPKGKKSVFCMGHDARLRERLIRAHLLGDDVSVVDSDGRTVKGSALAVAENQYGWQDYLREAEQRVKLRCAELAKKAKANPRLEKVGRTEQFPVVAVYRNKNGSSDVECVDRLGRKHWKHVEAKEKP
jgi:hypothetical protein